MTTPMNQPGQKTDKPADEDMRAPRGPRTGPMTEDERNAANRDHNSPLDTRNPDGIPKGMAEPNKTENQHTYQPDHDKGTGDVTYAKKDGSGTVTEKA